MHVELRREHGIAWVASASPTRPAPDLVGRDFAVDPPNQLWVADIERHEALSYRAVLKGRRLRLVAAGW